jgi:hypothetical protein
VILYTPAVALLVLAGWGVAGGLRAHAAERIGISALLGMGGLTLLMMLLHLAGLPISPLVYLPALVLLAAPGAVRLTRGARPGVDRQRRVGRGPLRHPVPAISAVALLASLLAVAVARAVYMPNTYYDSITAFDLLGKTIAAEKVFRVSLFDYTSLARGGSYPPFTALTFAWGYQCGLPSAGAAMVLPLLSFLVWIFGLARRFMGTTSALGLLLLAMLSPDFYTWCHLPLTNFPVAAFAAPAVLYLPLALRGGGSRELAIAAASGAFAVWTRAEAAAFVAGGFLALAGFGRGLRRATGSVVFAAPAVVLGLAWQLYVRETLGVSGADRFVPHLFWDAERAAFLLQHGLRLFFRVPSMGIVSFVFVAGLLSHVVARRGGAGPLAAALAAALAFYLALFYQADPLTQDPLESLLYSSYRRGLTAFVVPMWVAASISPLGAWVRRTVGALFSGPIAGTRA